MEEATSLEKAPPLSLKSVIKWRGKLRKVLEPYEGEVIKGPTFSRVLTELERTIGHLGSKDDPDNNLGLHCKDELRSALHKTIETGIVGFEIEPSDVSDMVNILAGNIQDLRYGTPVLPWKCQQHIEWALAVITDSVYHITPRKHIPGANITFQVLTGTATNQQFTQFFPDFTIQDMAKQFKLMHKEERRKIHYREVVRMRLAVRLLPGIEITTDRWEEKEALNAHNQILFKARSSLKERNCKYGFKHACHFCQVGYKDCTWGTHPDVFEERDCKLKHVGYFPAGDTSPYCLRCRSYIWKQQNS
jgi:hypothetical protein